MNIEQAYKSAKAANPDALCVFRIGDFYELFFDDAKVAAKTLGLTLTSRDKGENPMPMAGFPYHQLEGYLRKLVAEKHRVAVCERIEGPAEVRGEPVVLNSDPAVRRCQCKECGEMLMVQLRREETEGKEMTALIAHLRTLVDRQREAILAGNSADVDTWTLAILKVVGEMEEPRRHPMFEFKVPNVNFEGATAEERRIAEKFTAVREIVVKGFPDAHTAWLKVEGQSFCVSMHYSDTKEEAEWTCWMLAKALIRASELETKETSNA